MDFEVIQGDIAEQSAGALVNAANTSLRMRTGVASALREAAGGGIDHEAQSAAPLDLGEATVTDAYDLDAEWVIHAAAMPEDGEASERSVRNATRNALAAAEDLGVQSLVLPVLGTGEGGLDLEDGARAIAEAVDDHDPEALGEIRLIGYGDDEYETIRRAVDGE